MFVTRLWVKPFFLSVLPFIVKAKNRLRCCSRHSSYCKRVTKIMSCCEVLVRVMLHRFLKGRSHCVRRRTTTYDVVRPSMYYVCVVVLIEHVQSIGGVHTKHDVVRHCTYKSAQKYSMSRFLRFTTYDVVWDRAHIVRMLPILCACSIRTTTYDVVRSVNWTHVILMTIFDKSSSVDDHHVTSFVILCW